MHESGTMSAAVDDGKTSKANKTSANTRFTGNKLDIHAPSR
jgi:hypothetical protein